MCVLYYSIIYCIKFKLQGFAIKSLYFLFDINYFT